MSKPVDEPITAQIIQLKVWKSQILTVEEVKEDLRVLGEIRARIEVLQRELEERLLEYVRRGP
jgi:transcriptional regulator of NAD metabolism